MPPADTPAITIHPAAPADVKAIGRLGALLVKTHHDFDPQRFIAAELERIVEERRAATDARESKEQM